MRNLLLLLVWLAGVAQAQQLDPADVCRQARLSAVQRLLHAQAAVSASHRQQMDRYDVQWYKLDLALENTSRDVAGSVLLRVRALQALDSIAFELYQAPLGAPAGTPTLTIDSVVAAGRRSPGVRRRGQEATAALARPAAAGTVLDVRIYYHGTAPANTGATAGAGEGLRNTTSYYLDNVLYPANVTASLTEPFFAHEWFPCKQVLTDKADSAAVFITTSLPNKVGSNGVLRRTVALPGGKVRYEWATRYPIAYYLISVAVAPYVEYVRYASPGGGPRVPIVNYVYDQNALRYYQSAIDKTADFLESFSALVGTYPFAAEKYGHAMAPIGGGMEHQTMTTLSSFDAGLVAHELFHQWFGDHVTCASWQDIWLNEGFASYGEYLALQATATPAAARSWMDDAQNRARRDNTGTVQVPARDSAFTARIFSSNLSYKKGAALVHLLRYLCHDDARFFRVLRTYQQQFGGRAARTTDLQRLFEAELGQPLDYFFAQWYRGQGYPSFGVRWNQVGDQLFLEATETASAPAATPFFRTEVDYRLTLADGSQQVLRQWQEQPRQAYQVAVRGAVQRVEVDPDGWLPDLPGLVQRDATLVLAASGELAIYPNPCREQLIVSALPTGANVAEVHDALGRVVLRQSLADPAAAAPVLPTAALAGGLYVLRLRGPGGEDLGRVRFVKE